MIFSPLSEIPIIGASSIYTASAALFVIFQLPIVLSNSIATMLVFRFITGIFASPSLTLGGASVKAMYTARNQDIPMAIWNSSENIYFPGALITFSD